MFARLLLALCVGALVIASCGSSSAPTGIPADLQSRFQTVLDDARTQYGFPGVQAGVWTRDGEWIGNSGTAGQTDPRAITPEDRTRIGSITKTFTVTALLQLVEAGKVSLDDVIGKYVPGMPNGSSATLRNLATMTSGIPSFTGDTTVTKEYLAKPTTVFTAEQLVGSVKGMQPLFPPGTQMNYSNTNTVLLGMVVEQVTGKPIGTVLTETLYQPLGLNQTVFPAGSAEIPDPHLSGLTTQGDPVGEQKNSTDWNPSFANAAGEMISTLGDLRTWAVALGTGDKILRPETQQMRAESVRNSVPGNVPGHSYGLGIVDEQGWLGHTGEIPGYETVIGYDAASGSTIVVMVNSDVPSGSLPPAGPAIFGSLAAIVKPPTAETSPS